MGSLDWANLAAGGAIGGAIGFAASSGATLWLQSRHSPEVEPVGFFRRPGYRGGDLHKFAFRLNGRTAPGLCSIELTYRPTDGRPVSVLAKWDETANPWATLLVSDGSIKRVFSAERVPDTYFQPLHIGRYYTVPLVHECAEDDRLLFSGWWFDPEQPDPPVARVDGGELDIALTGAGLHWEDTFSIEEVCGGERLDEADSDARQQDLKRLLDSKHRRRDRRPLLRRKR
jgi:hypothetical protein